MSEEQVHITEEREYQIPPRPPVERVVFDLSQIVNLDVDSRISLIRSQIREEIKNERERT